ELYDPITNQFVDGPPMIYEDTDQTAIVIPSGPNQGKILFAGGFDDSRSTELYDPATNAFAPGPAMNMDRRDHTATVITTGPNTGKILLVGGWRWLDKSAAMVPLASTELYDPATNTFAAPADTPTLTVARAAHSATAVPSGPNAGKILISGGQADDRITLSSTELYDPASNSFTLGPPMRSARTRHIAMVIGSGPQAGKILIAGGIVNSPHNVAGCTDMCGIINFRYNDAECKSKHCAYFPLASTELYDPRSNRFEPGPRMHGKLGEAIAVQLPPAATIAAPAANAAPRR
ncbi:MAG: Kelch repeat-containing protein, partial [Candidatus Binataceae bacterium]